jgi:hypothetical protein
MGESTLRQAQSRHRWSGQMTDSFLQARVHRRRQLLANAAIAASRVGWLVECNVE